MYNYNRKSPAFYGGGLEGKLQVGSNRGQVWYVNGTNWGDGDDANSGLTPDAPFLTIKHALSVCTDEQFDTIAVVDYWTPTGEDWPIVVDKRCVTIVGTPGGTYNRWCCVHPDEDAAAFSIQAAGVRVIDFYIDAGASHPGIEFADPGGGPPERIGIYGCFFNTGTHGIEWGVNEAGAGIEIADCHFVSTLTAGGIEISNSPHCRIRNNVFVRPGGVCINVAHAAGGSQILNNVMAIDSDVAGRGITLAANTTEIVIDENSAFWGESVGVNNPYLDNAGANANSWGMNHFGNTHTLPA